MTEQIPKVYYDWYWNDNIPLRDFIHWEIFKDTGAKRHSVDFILEGKEVGALPNRFYKTGNIGFFKGQIKERFITSTLEPSWHFFRSNGYLRFTEDNKPVDLKKEFDNQLYGFDVIFDIDNKHFKKWWRNEGKLNHPDIYKVIMEGLFKTQRETSIIKYFLDEYGVPYILNFSGTGFRICIEWEDIKEHLIVEDFGLVDRAFIEWVLKESYPNDDNTGHKFECFGEIQSGYSLTRALYSLNPSSKLVCLPLSDKEFNEFVLDDVNPHNVLKRTQIVKGKSSLNKKRGGSFAKIFAKFEEKTPLHSIYQEKRDEEQEKLKKERLKNEIIDMINSLPNDEKVELLNQLNDC